MNCAEARDLLIDLVYGELPRAQAEALLAHLRACSRCRGEYERLRLARAALARHRRGEPPAAPALGIPQSVHRGRWIAAAAGVAAAVLAAVGTWHLLTEVPPVHAGPVEIKRLDVSLTILSRPADRPAPVPLQAAAPPRGWKGLALVRDRRIIRNLKRGQTEVRFTEVPAGILPDTVRLRSLAEQGGLTILEQNYQYDLASADRLLEKYINRPVAVTFKDGGSVRGRLLSFDASNLVLQPDGAGPRTLSREKVRAVTLAKLPEGLLSRPTLVWKLNNTGPAIQRFEVAYMTRGLGWRADYVLKLRPGAGRVQGDPPEVIDSAELVGYATVTNLSGVTYEHAQLKLLAGDVNLIPPEVWQVHELPNDAARIEGGGGFREKAFFEYHLYTLSRPTTIRNAETKQIELVSAGGLRLKRSYVYDRTQHPTAARVVSELKNSDLNGLGKPLPKGVVRLYAPDPDGLQTYVGRTTIDHTPKDEKIRLPWGYASDIVCSARQIGGGRDGNTRSQTWRYEIRNHKPHDVTVTVVVRVPRSTGWANCTRRGREYPWHVREVGVVEIDVPVKAGSAERVVFTFRYDPLSGGGLTSPWEARGRS